MKLVWLKSDIIRNQEEKQLKDVVDKIKIIPVKAIGKSFIEGLNNIVFMLQLPRLVLLHSIVHSETLVEGLQIVSRFREDMNEKALNDILEELRAMLAEIPIDKETISRRYEQVASPGGVVWANLELERIIKSHEQHEKSFLTLIYSAVVWIWTLFEVAASDLWETALNVNFDTLGKDALQRMVKDYASPVYEDKMSGKYIKIGYLAEFDYNIRDNVGSILKRYFDFTSLIGIKNAYNFVFPKSVTLEKSLSNDILRSLSEDRNLIVHNGGYIDLRYKNLTNTAQNIGEQLDIGENTCDDYLAAAIRTFRDMLNCVNDYTEMGRKDTTNTNSV